MIAELNVDAERSYHDNFLWIKKEALDYAFKRFHYKSFAELGCVWNIECAYGLYILEKYKAEKGVFVDTHWTESARKRCGEYKAASVLEGNFGESTMPELVGKVDVIILFDILPHQVAPDWDRVLQMYAPMTEAFIVVEPIFNASPITVRLMDLGREEYFRNTPHPPDHPTYKALFEKMYEMHPEHKRIWRDIHNVWQWGITKADLVFRMDQLGFTPDFLKCDGRFYNMDHFDYYSFVFVRKQNQI